MPATAVKVVDASAIAAILFQEPEGAAVAARLQGSRLVAPQLLMTELANVCAMKCKRHAANREVFVAAFALLPRLDIEQADVDYDGVLRLALETGLTAYDASYLWLARELAAELVTFDKALQRTMGG